MIIFNALQTTLSGGIGRYSYELSKSLYNINDEIKIVIRKEDEKLFYFANKDDLIVVENISSGIKRNIYEQLKLPFLVKKKYPNAILHYPDSMAPLLSTNKVVITVHDIAFKTLKDVFTWKTKLWKNFATKLSLKKANKIISISKYTKEEIINHYGEKYENKIEVVYNGFNDFSNEDIEFANIRKNLLDLSEKKFILTVSTISPRKNIDGLIKAYNSLECKDNVLLVIAGSYGWLYEDIIKLADDLNLNGKVIFTGKINDDELKYLYKKCTLFTYLSFYEGFGLPPLEAMSYGKTCIVSNTSSLPEVVGNAAIQVNPYKINEIKDNIQKEMNEESIRKEDIVSNTHNFSWNKCAEKTLCVYYKV